MGCIVGSAVGERFSIEMVLAVFGSTLPLTAFAGFVHLIILIAMWKRVILIALSSVLFCCVSFVLCSIFARAASSI